MKKKYIILFICLFVIGGVITYLKLSTVHPVYLDDTYYDTGKYIDISADELNELTNDNHTFILFVYNDSCSLPIPCENIFEDAMNDTHVNILKIRFADFKNTSLYQTVKLAPSIIIVSHGKIVTYLKADADADLEKYQNKEVFINWLKKYVYLEK